MLYAVAVFFDEKKSSSSYDVGNDDQRSDTAQIHTYFQCVRTHLHKTCQIVWIFGIGQSKTIIAGCMGVTTNHFISLNSHCMRTFFKLKCILISYPVRVSHLFFLLAYSDTEICVNETEIYF